MPRFVDIDLTQLPPADAVELIDYAALVEARKLAVLDRIADADLRAEVAAVLAIEAEPITIDVEAGAYRETIVRQRINDAVRAVMLATSAGTDLDQLCARLGVERQVVDPGNPAANPPVPPTLETDERLKERYQLAMEAFSTAGPYGAYRFHALSAHPHVLDVGVYGPEEDFVDLGHARVVVLSSHGTGAPTQQVLDAVAAKLSGDDTRPLTDFVDVVAAGVTTYAISVNLEVQRGPDPLIVKTSAEENLATYVEGRRRVGAPITLSGLYDAAHGPGVERATLVSPTAEIDPGKQGAAHCTGITVTYEIVDG